MSPAKAGLKEASSKDMGKAIVRAEQQTNRAQHAASTTIPFFEKEHGTKSTVQFHEMATLENGSHLTTDSTLASSLESKSPSLGGKSTASVVTFAMDEKESLRPDDSASIVAAATAEEEEELQGQNIDPIDSSNGSNEDVRAFREQLNEISAIDPLRRSTAVGVNQDGAPAQGVLYVPASNHVPLPGLVHQIPGELYESLPDVKLLEALENPRDRIWVLKLEQDVIDFVKDAKEPSLVLPQCNSFYRMLAHKIADYYMLGHSVDDSNSAVRLFKTAACRIPRPLTGVITPSTAASTPPPNLQMTILRRGMDATGPAIANGSGMPSKSTSEAGESIEGDARPLSLQEREARYEAARLRILGSAKPEDTSDTTKDESRPSSTTGKKVKKGKRDYSDDDFEARSSYNSFFAQPQPQSGYQSYIGSGAQPQFSQPYPQVAGYPQYAPPAQGQYWGPPAQDGSTNWTQSPAATFDLAHEFDRSMSFQQTPTAYSATHSPYGQPPFQSASPYQYGWPQSALPGNGHFSPSGAFSPYADRPSSSASQPTYAYGQLPSQALGRPPNALEHPLPGSYKSRHFNPQSQTFIPTLATRPFLPQRTMSGPNVASPVGLERQLSTQTQGAQINSPGIVSPGSISSRMPTHSMTHPLPQPVFPSQAPPAVSLPPKPTATQRMSFDADRTPKGTNAMQPSESTIAKWGTPASLPAKPPPSAGKQDAEKTPQRSAQSGFNLPSFGSMPAGGGV
ncbi:hypothetical protein AMS68_002897 [Peltaster fructicola]|uniref:SUZ domain-containing protein n=1 Tax=Peltaster fructicola TaxID=286661 RepID=A0A6H0XSD4_9PEZI|nr:hypothetical protein AMS68_002897 [Peltaster fructicola]